MKPIKMLCLFIGKVSKTTYGTYLFLFSAKDSFLKYKSSRQSVIFVHQSIRVKIFDDKVCEFEEVESSYEEELNVTRLKTQQLHSEVFMMSSLSPCKQNFIISLSIVNCH